MASAAQAARELPEGSLFRIGEVSRLTATKAFVLRYWESEFPTLQPVKSPTGHRLYRREDIETVFEIKRLLYDEGFTIAGARRHLRETAGGIDGDPAGNSGRTTVAHDGAHGESLPPILNRKMLLDLRDSLRAFLTLLEKRQ